MEVITLEIDLNSSCRLCLSLHTELISIFQENLRDLVRKHLNILVCIFLLRS